MDFWFGMVRLGFGETFNAKSILFMCRSWWIQGALCSSLAKCATGRTVWAQTVSLHGFNRRPCPCLGMVFDALYIRAPWTKRDLTAGSVRRWKFEY
jgi:hypothetical protein